MYWYCRPTFGAILENPSFWFPFCGIGKVQNKFRRKESESDRQPRVELYLRLIHTYSQFHIRLWFLHFNLFSVENLKYFPSFHDSIGKLTRQRLKVTVKQEWYHSRIASEQWTLDYLISFQNCQCILDLNLRFYAPEISVNILDICRYMRYLWIYSISTDICYNRYLLLSEISVRYPWNPQISVIFIRYL